MSITIFDNDNIRGEMNHIFKNQKTETDIVFTRHVASSNMMCYNQAEFLPQINLWKGQNAVSRYSNIRKLSINNEECYMFVVQLRKKRMNICPLAASFGLLVEGVAYITTSNNMLKIVQRSIGIDTMNGKGLEFCE